MLKVSEKRLNMFDKPEQSGIVSFTPLSKIFHFDQSGQFRNYRENWIDWRTPKWDLLPGGESHCDS